MHIWLQRIATLEGVRDKTTRCRDGGELAQNLPRSLDRTDDRRTLNQHLFYVGERDRQRQQLPLRKIHLSRCLPALSEYLRRSQFVQLRL